MAWSFESCKFDLISDMGTLLIGHQLVQIVGGCTAGWWFLIDGLKAFSGSRLLVTRIQTIGFSQTDDWICPVLLWWAQTFQKLHFQTHNTFQKTKTKTFIWLNMLTNSLPCSSEVSSDNMLYLFLKHKMVWNRTVEKSQTKRSWVYYHFYTCRHCIYYWSHII